MAQTINTNIASLSAQRNLAASQKDAATAMQRLSSGLRINSAKDDAAGLAIANRLTSQINGINQAVRNANDGLSVSQVAEGALSETSDILQRMRTLAVQSLNASNSDSDRSKLQSEVTELKNEIDRIAFNTSFGSTKLLNGSFTSKSFQVGANTGETIDLTISNMKASALGQVTNLAFGTNEVGFESAQVYAAATSGLTAQDLTFTVDGTDTTVSIAADASAKDIANAVSSQVGSVSATAATNVTINNLAKGTSGASVTVSVNGISLGALATATEEGFANALVAAMATKTELSGLTATAVNTGASNATTGVEIVDADGDDVTVTITAASQAADGTGTAVTDATFDVMSVLATGGVVVADATHGEKQLTSNGSTNVASVTGHVQFTTDLATSKSISVTGAGTGAGQLAGTSVAGTLTASGTYMDTVSVATVANASTAVGMIDKALSEVDSARASLGAVQSRFDSVIANLANIAENSSAARSRIMDADFAAETAALAKTQILQQAGISVLAQANAQPQNVLALLQ